MGGGEDSGGFSGFFLCRQKGKAGRSASREPGKANALEARERGEHAPDFRNKFSGRRFEIVAARERIGQKRVEVTAEIEPLFGGSRNRPQRLGTKSGIDRVGG